MLFLGTDNGSTARSHGYPPGLPHRFCYKSDVVAEIAAVFVVYEVLKCEMLRFFGVRGSDFVVAG